jgi:hypothetical protein
VTDDLLVLNEDDFNLLDELPVCGCGIPRLALETYHKALAAAVAFGDDGETGPNPFEPTDGDETLFYIVAGVLDQIEATEHGGTIHWAWATDKGRRLLVLLDRWAESGYEARPAYNITGSTP